MKALDLTILLQQLENYKNFQYNNHMKSKEELNKLAQEIAQLEKIIQKGSFEDKNVKSAMNRIEIIMESLSLKESLELNDTVMNILKMIDFS